MSATSGGASTVNDNKSVSSLHSSSKYKTYSQNVDRALRTFENSNEWADLISALGRLTKVIHMISYLYNWFSGISIKCQVQRYT